MFLVSHSLELRAKEIQAWLPKHPSIALIVAAVYFEWTLCRAFVGLSKCPNKEVRKQLEKIHGLDDYKDFWRDQLGHLVNARRLSQVVMGGLMERMMDVAMGGWIEGRVWPGVDIFEFQVSDF